MSTLIRLFLVADMATTRVVTPVQVLREIKRTLRDRRIRQGRERYVVMDDGSILSLQAIRENWREVVYATLRSNRSGWHASHVDFYMSSKPLFCDHLGIPIIGRINKRRIKRFDQTMTDQLTA